MSLFNIFTEKITIELGNHNCKAMSQSGIFVLCKSVLLFNMKDCFVPLLHDDTMLGTPPGTIAHARKLFFKGHPRLHCAPSTMVNLLLNELQKRSPRLLRFKQKRILLIVPDTFPTNQLYRLKRQIGQIPNVSSIEVTTPMNELLKHNLTLYYNKMLKKAVRVF